MKSQSSIEKVILTSVIIIVSLFILFFIYGKTIKLQNAESTNYLTNINFGNIYINKNNVFITAKNKVSLGSNAIAYLKIEYENGTTNTINIEYILNSSYKTQNNETIYDFNTTNFNLNLPETTYFNLSLIMLKTNNMTLEPAYNSNSKIIYYPANAFSTLKIYMLNTTVSPMNGGTVSPHTQYYYSGTKVLLNAVANPNYAFVDWHGYGAGNYTGPNSIQTITINNNITEIAYFEPIIPVNFNSTYSGIPFTINFNDYKTNTTVGLTQNQQYKYSFPNYNILSSGVRYSLVSISGCGYSGNNQTITATYGLNNCIIFAKYIKQYYLTIYSSNSIRGTVYPYSGWYDAGSSVKISATPNYGYVFTNWVGSGNGNYTGTNNITTIIMNSPINEIANFKTYTITYNPTSGSFPNPVIYNKNTSLTGDILAYSITIDNGINLTTNGYALICNNTFINNGVIHTGFSNLGYGGVGGSTNSGNGGNGGSVPNSYGGSGGGGGGGQGVNGDNGGSGGNGGNTQVSGGSGGPGVSGWGYSGSSVTPPTITNPLIQTWYSSGFNNYLDGAGGGGGGGGAYVGGGVGGSGGKGGSGIYIQANKIIAGTINSNGSEGITGYYPSSLYTGGSGGGGGGGGGTIILAYGSGGYIAGSHNTNGGSGGYGGSTPGGAGGGSGGSGGNGELITYNYVTPPIQAPPNSN